MTPTDLVDLHLHSSCSDGSDTPAELVRTAFDHGCRSIALTDHDTLSGLGQASEQARALNMQLISGVEISIPFQQRTMHLLVYLNDGAHEALEEHLRVLQTGRRERNRAIAKAMADDGIPITYEQVVVQAGSEEGLGRPHFAATLVNLGVADTIDDAFDRFLATGRPYDLARKSLTLDEALELVRASHAISVVAHPMTLGYTTTTLGSIATELRERGVDGLEVYYSRYRPEIRLELEAIAHAAGLLATGGSDYHGTYKIGLKPGVGEGDLRVPLRCFTDLSDELSRR